jgi:hypothetical protein
MTSAYKIASNRRNGQLHSTGPKSDTGKQRVRYNALKHGLTAQTAVLPDEDPEAFAQHRDALLAAFQPSDKIELELAKTFALATWKRDRCARTETSQIAHRMEHAEGDEAAKEQHEVIYLGKRLFEDPRGDERNYPHGFQHFVGQPGTSYCSLTSGDPAYILIDLERTITGCRWLLARWKELKDPLSPGLAWQSLDKLKACRLLGKQPLDAPDDPVVCLIFVASYVADPQYMKGNPFSELQQEFKEKSRDYLCFMDRLRERPWKALQPKDAAEARQKLAEIVDKATARLEMIIAAHEQHVARYAGQTAARFAFDPSDEAERLRRYERACTGDMFRSLSALAKHRQGALQGDGKTPSSGDQPDAPARDSEPVEPRTSDGQWYQPDVLARDSEPVGSRSADGDEYQPDAPATLVLPVIDWPSRPEYLPDAAQSVPHPAGEKLRHAERACYYTSATDRAGEMLRHAERACCFTSPSDHAGGDHDNGAAAVGDGSELRNKANADYSDWDASARQADLSAGRNEPRSDPPTPTDPPPHEPSASSLNPPQADFASLNLHSATGGFRFAQPSSFSPLPWLAFSDPDRMAKAAEALAKRREVDRVDLKREREERRHKKAERLKRERQEAQAERDRDAAALTQITPPAQEEEPSAENQEPVFQT